MDYSVNFKGAFLVKQPTQTLIKNDLTPLLGKRHQIINDVKRNGDVLYVVRNSFDKGIADLLIKTKGAKFKYYPELNTKSGFDTEKPEEAGNILRTAAKTIIDSKLKLEKFFAPKPKKPVDIVSVQANNLKTIQKETFIDIAGSEYRTNIDHQNGICSVYTMVKSKKTGKKNVRHSLIRITPPDRYGISYARITPVSQDDSCRRLAIKNGEVIFEYKQPASEIFIRNEEAAKEYYSGLMEKYKEELLQFKKA